MITSVSGGSTFMTQIDLLKYFFSWKLTLEKPVKFALTVELRQVKKICQNVSTNVIAAGIQLIEMPAAQVVLRRGLAAVGHTVKMLPGGQGRWTPYELRIFALIGRRVSTNHLRIGATTGRLRLQNAIFCCS